MTVFVNLIGVNSINVNSEYDRIPVIGAFRGIPLGLSEILSPVKFRVWHLGLAGH
jgi:hypothetical protein